MTTRLVFVYGSLRRRAANGMSLQFPHSKFIADAWVQGTLYDLGAYPGLRLDGANSMVKGDVFEIDDETLKELDEFEASSNYLRKRVETTAAGQTMLCWVYEPDPELYALNKAIESGDWIDYSGEKSGVRIQESEF